jgi:hypothetical protein
MNYLTDEEPEKSSPSRKALNKWFIQDRRQLGTHFVAEGYQNEYHEKKDGEREAHGYEYRSALRRCRKR